MSKSARTGFACVFLLCAAPACNSGPARPIAVITIDPAVTHQTIVGWEATAQAGQYDPAFARFADTLFDEAVSDLGINRIRVEVRSGLEHPRDLWSQVRSGRVDAGVLQSARYCVGNDDADPHTLNRQGFQFAELDFDIGTVVLPLRRRLAARGERLYLIGTYVAFHGECDRPSVHENPEEYAEFVVAVYQHLLQKHGFVPDAWEVILEPDNTRFWRGRQIGEAIAATSRRLASAGFRPRFIAPSCSSVWDAITYFDDLIRVEGVRPHLAELSYHRYSGAWRWNLRRLARRAQKYGLATSMLENIGATADDLHEDLVVAGVSAWQQYTLAFPTEDNGAQYYIVDASPAAPSIRLGARSRLLRQYFRYVRAGARRIGAEGDTRGWDPVAFVNRDGGYVVVIRCFRTGEAELRTLPAGTYVVSYATRSGLESSRLATVEPREPLRVTLPEPAILTVAMKPRASAVGERRGAGPRE